MKRPKKVRVISSINLTPHAHVRSGETGRIVGTDDEETWVRLDLFHPGLVEWDNCIWFNRYTVPLDETIETITERAPGKSLTHMAKASCGFLCSILALLL